MKLFTRLLPVLAASLVLLLLPGAAAAQNGTPGNAGLDEYSEGVPGSGGENPSGGGGDGGGDGGSSLPAPVADDLSGSGSDGSALAAAIDATAPDSKKLEDAAKAAAEGGDGGGAGPVEALDTGTEGAGLAAITAAAEDSEGGMGVVLPLLLAAAAVLAIGFVAARARRT